MSINLKENPNSKVEKSTKKTTRKTTTALKTDQDISKAPQEEKNSSEQTICIIRIRGSPGMRRSILNTLQLFNLHKVHHATLVRSNPSVLGMLQKSKDYIAYGSIDIEMLKKLLKKRALLTGNKPLTDNHVKFCTDYDSIDNLANGIFEGKIKLRDIKDLKPIFRLHPPLGGFSGTIKKAFKAGGVLGNMGNNINILLKNMI